MRRHLTQYIRFSIVGTAVAIIAVAVREIVAGLLPPSAYRFTISIAIVWTMGILFGFHLNRSYTFPSEAKRRASLARYSLISIAAGVLCVTISNVLLDGLTSSLPTLAHRETIAFVIGNLLASITSFVAYRLLVFA